MTEKNEYNKFHDNCDRLLTILNTVLPNLKYIVKDFSFWKDMDPQLKITKEMELLEIQFEYYASLIITSERIFIKPEYGRNEDVLKYNNWDELLTYIEKRRSE